LHLQQEDVEGEEVSNTVTRDEEADCSTAGTIERLGLCLTDTLSFIFGAGVLEGDRVERSDDGRTSPTHTQTQTPTQTQAPVATANDADGVDNSSPSNRSIIENMGSNPLYEETGVEVGTPVHPPVEEDWFVSVPEKNASAMTVTEIISNSLREHQELIGWQVRYKRRIRNELK
jgi:hypothetical protein